jgi:hypothetical protein
MVLGATARNTSRSASRHSLGQWERIAGRPVVRPRLAPLSRLALLDLRRALRGLVIGSRPNPPRKPVLDEPQDREA